VLTSYVHGGGTTKSVGPRDNDADADAPVSGDRDLHGTTKDTCPEPSSVAEGIPTGMAT